MQCVGSDNNQGFVPPFHPSACGQHSLQHPPPLQRQSAIECRTPGIWSMRTDDELGHREGVSHPEGMTIGRLWGRPFGRADP